MSKKMMKRSLALGALMAFVITGSAMAASVVNGDVETFTGEEIVADASDASVEAANRSYGLAVTSGSHTLADGDKLTITNNMTGTERNYGIVLKNDAKLTINREVEIKVSHSGVDNIHVRGIRNSGNGAVLTFNKDVVVNATLTNSKTTDYDKQSYVTGMDTWNGTTTFNGNVEVTVTGNELSNSWTNAVQVGDEGTINFNGDITNLTANSSGYTAQAINSTNSEAVANFESTVVNIEAKSDVGVNGIGGSGVAKFFGKDAIVNIDVLVDKNDDRVGDAGTSNAIGVMSNLEVSDAVKEFNIDVKGSGLDSKNPGATNGTAAIFALGDQVEVNAQKFTANVIAGTDVARTDNTYGIRASVGGNVAINSAIINIGVTDDLGSAYGVRANCNDLTNGTTTYDNAGTINLGGDNSVITIDATAKNGYAVGIAAHRSNDNNKENASAVTVNGKSLTINASGETAYGVLGMNNTTGTAENVSTVTINSADTTINAKSGLVALSQSEINVNGNLTVNSKGGDAIVSRGGATVNINTEGKDKVVKLTGDIDFNYDKATSGSAIDATVNLNLTNADSFFTGKIYRSGNPELPADKSALSGMNISLSNGANWNLTGASDVNAATFGAGSVLNIDGATFEESKGVYALNGVGDGDVLTVDKGALITVEGMDKATYNIATGFENIESEEYWTVVNDNALMKAEWEKETNNDLKLVVSAKDAGELADSGATSESTSELISSITNAISNGTVDPNNSAQQAAADFIQNVVKNNPTPEGVKQATDAAAKMAEAGGNNATAASIVKNVTGVTNDRLSFNCGHSAPHKGGHGVGLLEEGSGADVWVEYVHGKDEVEDMPSTAGATSYEGQYNGIVMGVDFKKVNKFQSGVAFNYGEGDTNSIGGVARTHSDYDFWGIGYYGNIHNDDSNVIFDINYAKTDSDVTQDNSGHTFEASPETTTWSAGVKVEKLYQNNNVQIVPYTGVRYMSIDSDDYSTSGGEFNYSMERQDIWLLPLGVSIRQEIENDNGWTVSPRVDLSYIWAFGDTNSNMEVKSPFSGVSQLGYDVMDDGSFLGLVGIEAHKGQWGYGVSYSYQKGDHSESKKWYVDVNYSF